MKAAQGGAVCKPTIDVAKEFAGELKPPTHPPGSTPQNCALLYSSSSQSPCFKGVIRISVNGQLYWVMTGMRQTESGRLVMEIELTPKKASGKPL